MKRFALALAMLAMLGLNMGCNGGDSATETPEEPAVETPDETGDNADNADAPAGEGE